MQKFAVSGMTCAHCVKAVRGAALRLAPEVEVTVDLGRQEVDVTPALPAAAFCAALEELGYGAKEIP